MVPFLVQRRHLWMLALLVTACSVDRQAVVPEGGPERSDSGTPDAAMDSGIDAALDPDAGRDATIPMDTGPDAPTAGDDAGDASIGDAGDAATPGDAGSDGAIDASFDAGVDSGIDAGVDSGIDAGVDAGVDAGGLPSGGCGGPLGQRKLLIIDGTRVSGTLVNFPVLVSLTDPDLAASASPSGADLCFTDSTGQTALPFEIERWTQANGNLLAWVRLPTLAAGQNTTFYLHYGGMGPATTPAATLVWDANYAAVYHLGPMATPNYADSTINGNTATPAGPGSVTGRIAQAADFDGSDDVINCGSASSVDNVLSGGGTLEAWIRPADWGENSYGRILDKSSDPAPDGGWGFYVNDSTRNAGMGLSHSFGTNYSAWFTDDDVLTLDTWHHVAVTYNSSDVNDAPRFYIDGVLVGSSHYGITSNPGPTPDNDSAQPLLIGNAANGTTRTFDGTIDEVRLSRTIRSPQWLSTAHRNQADPSGFLSAGPEESTR